MGNAGWSIKAGPDPQSFPREVIDAAVAAGVAEIVPPQRRGAEAARAAKDGDGPTTEAGEA